MNTAKELARNTVLIVVPVFVAYLVMRQDARTTLVMSVSHHAKTLCQWQADIWQSLATRCAQTYNNARL